MKKGIIIGVCAVTLLLCMTPTISAQQTTLMEDAIEDEYQYHFDAWIAALDTIRIDTSQIEEQRNQVEEMISSMEESLELIDEQEAKPTCIKFLINTLISLILAALGTLFGIILGPLLALLVKVLTAPAVLLAKIIAFFLEGNEIAT